MNPITQKLLEISPTYKPHNTQNHAIRTSENPQVIADSIDEKMETLGALAERYWGKGVADVEDLMTGLTLYSPNVINPKTAPIGFLIGNLPKERIFELGYKAAEVQQGVSQLSVVEAAARGIYILILGREPTSKGLANMMKQINRGTLVSKLAARMEYNKENGAQ